MTERTTYRGGFHVQMPMLASVSRRRRASPIATGALLSALVSARWKPSWTLPTHVLAKRVWGVHEASLVLVSRKNR